MGCFKLLPTLTLTKNLIRFRIYKHKVLIGLSIDISKYIESDSYLTKL